MRVKHVTRYEKSREERQFDPIRQFYRDNSRDEMSRTRNQQETMYRLNRARVRACAVAVLCSGRVCSGRVCSGRLQ